jgi:hypothetical protein
MVSEEIDKFTGTVVGGFNKASNAAKVLRKLVRSMSTAWFRPTSSSI